MAGTRFNQYRLLLACLICAAGIFVLDIFLVLSVARGVLYVLVVLLSLEFRDTRMPLVVAGICSVLAMAGLALQVHPDPAEAWQGLLNRTLSMMAIWATAILGQERCRANDALMQTLDTMELRVRERTRELAHINSQLQSEMTDRQRAEERFRTLLESAPDAMVIVNNEGKIFLVNAETERLFGWSRSQLLGEPVEKLIPNEAWQQRARRPAPFGLAADAAEPVQALELFAKHCMGHEIPVEISLSPLQTKSGTFVSTVIRDITLRKQMQRKLVDTHRKLVQNERLAAIGEMVAGIAHESRNALQRSCVCVDMLEHRTVDPESRELLEGIASAQDDLSRLYEQVRQYAAPIQLERRRCRLDRVVNKAWGDVCVAREISDAELLHERQVEDLFCRIDPFACEQIFRNILENALDAAPAGRIDVVWSDDMIGGKPAIRVEFRDAGPGISEEHRKSLFKPFFTTRTKGTGLGMAICKRLVEAHGGSIGIGQSQNGCGAVIAVKMPRRGAKA